MRGWLVALTVLLQGCGIGCILLWMLSSDLLFGHYSGPLSLLWVGTGLLVLTALLAVPASIGRLRDGSPRSLAKRLALLAWLSFAALSTGLSGLIAWSEYAKYHEIAQRYIGWLRDPRADIRYQAATMLWAYGPLVAEAEPALRQALHDPDPRVRQGAADAIASIHGNKYPGVRSSPSTP
jgi:HEAT repeats